MNNMDVFVANEYLERRQRVEKRQQQKVAKLELDIKTGSREPIKLLCKLMSAKLVAHGLHAEL